MSKKQVKRESLRLQKMAEEHHKELEEAAWKDGAKGNKAEAEEQKRLAKVAAKAERKELLAVESGEKEPEEPKLPESAPIAAAADKHPERRVKAAFQKYEDRHLDRLRAQNPTLRLSQVKEILKKQWEKAPENPLNQAE